MALPSVSQVALQLALLQQLADCKCRHTRYLHNRYAYVLQVERLSVSQIALQLALLQQLAAAGRLPAEALAGGTITVSNIGERGAPLHLLLCLYPHPRQRGRLRASTGTPLVILPCCVLIHNPRHPVRHLRHTAGGAPCCALTHTSHPTPSAVS